MAFLSEPEPVRDRAEPVLTGVRRIVAANSGPMTYHGTNTYLIDTAGGTIVLDPGPDLPDHVAAIVGAAPRVIAILVSHRHPDHFGAAAALRGATGAPIAAYPASGPGDVLTPDLPLAEGQSFGPILPLHTPGHAADHLCFAYRTSDGERVLFSGDHVMSWSSSVVSPPGGNMRAYFASLERLLGRDDTLYLPGHGPKLPDPHHLVRDLLAHRRAREAAIAARLGDGAADTATLTDALYAKQHPTLRRAAERNVLAHLRKLEEEGRVAQLGAKWKLAG
ncbi:MAG: MBL fold metallo-hydrolase [Acetobacteraceae bacterium]|nr:MBL fold metallo-hydrolase [Acetobacteraceae bacterium]